MAGRLSTRETEVLALAAHSLTYKEIATRLGISTRTARNHLTNIYGKLGIHDRAAAALAQSASAWSKSEWAKRSRPALTAVGSHVRQVAPEGLARHCDLPAAV